MCEVLIDDFSLLNSETPTGDAWLEILGSDSGFNRGHAEAVHSIVESSLLRYQRIVREDNRTGREITVPIVVHGIHNAAREDMIAKVDLALRNPKRVTHIPCDEWGAPTWWAIESADLTPIEDDFREVKHGEVALTVTLGVEAFGHSTEPYAVVADPDVAPDVVWDVTTDGVTGWTASGGTLANSVGNYVGVTANGTDEVLLSNASLPWSLAGFNRITVEWSATSSGNPPIGVIALSGSGSTDVTPGSQIARVNMGGGWYADSFLLNSLTPSWTGIRIENTVMVAGQFFRIRKITLEADSGSGLYKNLYFDLPGSAPTNGAITLSGDVAAGLILYTCPNSEEAAGMPVQLAGSMSAGAWNSNNTDAVWPRGNYHLLVRFTTVGAVDTLNWEVKGATYGGSDIIQTGTMAIADMPGGTIGPTTGQKWVVLANDIYLPPQGLPPGELATASVKITKGSAGTSITVSAVLLVWMGDPMTGENSPAYTLLDPRDTHTVVQAWSPTPERPVWGVFSGTTFDGIYQEHRAIAEVGKHRLPPGVSRVFVAFASGTSPTVEIAYECYPAWLRGAVPPARWTQTP